MLLIIILSTLAIVWVGVLAVLGGLCLSAAAGDRLLPRRRARVAQRRFTPSRFRSRG